MPNKYSHAFVLSNYEAQGLTRFDGNRVPKPHAEYVTSWKRHPTPDPASAPRPISSLNLSTGRRSISPRRLRLDSPSPPPLATDGPNAPPPHQRTNTNQSVVTQIYAPEADGYLANATEKDQRHSQTRGDHSAASRRRSLKLEKQSDPRQQAERQIHTSPSYVSYRTVTSADDRAHGGLEEHNSRSLHSPRPLSYGPRSQSNDTPMFFPKTTSVSPPTAVRRSSARPPAPNYLRSPPSPPLTPKDWRGLSLQTYLDSGPPLPKRSPAKVLTPPIPEWSPRRSLEASPSISLFTKPSIGSHATSDAPRPATSTGAMLKRNSRALSIIARTSSLKATAFPHSGSENSQDSHPDSQSPPFSDELNFAEPDFSEEPLFLADLESLPKFSDEFVEHDLPNELPADLDFEILPWEDARCRDTIPSALQRPASPSVISTRATSFDSAAPPAIGLTRFNGPLPDRSKSKWQLPDRSRPGPPPVSKAQSNLRKSARKSFSSLFYARSQTPISVPYQSTAPGKQPTHVSVSRTSAPSIPALFPNFKGAWPPGKAAVTPTGHQHPPHAPSKSTSPIKRASVPATPTASRVAPFQNPIASTVAKTAPSAVAPPASSFRQNGPAPRTLVRVPSKILSEGPAPLAETLPRTRGQSVGAPVVGSRRPGTAGSERRRSWFNTDTLDRTFGSRDTRELGRNGFYEVAPGLM